VNSTGWEKYIPCTYQITSTDHCEYMKCQC